MSETVRFKGWDDAAKDKRIAELEAENAKLREAMVSARGDLVNVLCDPEERCQIRGSDADVAVVDKALATLLDGMADE